MATTLGETNGWASAMVTRVVPALAAAAVIGLAGMWVTQSRAMAAIDKRLAVREANAYTSQEHNEYERTHSAAHVAAAAAAVESQATMTAAINQINITMAGMQAELRHIREELQKP